MNNSDVKKITFAEEFDIQCTYFVKEGVPEAKTLKFILCMVTPDGKDPVIFEKEINMSMHFGPNF